MIVDINLVSPHTKDCDVEHYPDCYLFESCNCWCHSHNYSDLNGVPDYDYNHYQSKYNWYSIYYNLIKCDKCTYTIPDHYTDYSHSFFTNDISKQILCEDCFYLENEE